jgi:hypothetical protein
MKAIIYWLGPDYADIIREIAIRAEQPTAATAFTAGVEMHNLTGCMHTGVGSTSANDLDLFIGDFGQRCFDASLHAFAGALTLPAVVRRSVVLKT